MVTRTQIRVIKVVNKVEGNADLKKLANEYARTNKTLSNMGRSMKRIGKDTNFLSASFRNLNRSLGNIRNQFIGLLASLGIREITGVIDRFQLLKDRITSFSGSATLGKEAFDKITKAAEFTKTSVEDFSVAYQRINIATQELGLSIDQTLGATIALRQAFRVAGSSADEANSVLIQLSQGLAANSLQGQELRSVLLSNAVITKILKDEFKTTTAGLKKLGEQGAIPAGRVLKALAANFDDLNKRAAGLRPTIGQTLTILFDRFRVRVSQLADEIGLTSKFAAGIDYLLANIPRLAKFFKDLAITVGILVSGALLFKVALGMKAVAEAILLITVVAGGIKPVVLAAASSLGTLSVAALATKAALGGIVLVAGLLTFQAVKDIELFSAQTSLAFYKVNQAIQSTESAIIRFIVDKLSLLSNPFGIGGAEKTALVALLGLVGVRSKKTGEEVDKLTKVVAKLKEENEKKLKDGGIKELLEVISKANKELKTSGDTYTDIEKRIASLNNEFLKTGNSAAYFSYNQQLAKIETEDLNKKFTEGKITLDQYYNSLTKIRDASGNVTISMQILNGAIIGVDQALKNVGNLTTFTASVVTNAFQGLEDQMVNLSKNGKFAFKDFANSLIEDVRRMIIRLLILKPLLDSIRAGLYGNAVVSTVVSAGAGSSGQSLPQASGARNAIPLPAQRSNSNANRSVTNVTVNNNANAQAEVTETVGANGQRNIDITIVNAVKSAVSSGRFDRTFNESYGLNRRGR